jgi:branched-chain amino acid transport system permease protein
MTNQILRNLVCILVGIIVFIFLPILFRNEYWISVFILAWINILLVAGLRNITIVGHFSLGQVGFALIGAFSSTLLVMRYNVPFWVAIILAGIFSAIVALLIGYPFLKVKGVYFAVLTLLTAETFRLTLYNLIDISGGALGLVGIPRPKPMIFPVIGEITFESINNYYYLTFFIVFLCLLILYLVEKSTLGFKWRAICDSNGLAQSLGINISRLKVINFSIACFFAGIAGALFAHSQQVLNTQAASKFGIMSSIYLAVYLIVGGTSSYVGSVIGVFVISLISELARPLEAYQPIFIGCIALLIVLFIPKGLINLPNQVVLWYEELTLQKKTTAKCK